MKSPKISKGVLEFLTRADKREQSGQTLGQRLFGTAQADAERAMMNDPMMGESVLDMFNRLKKDVGGELPFLPVYAHDALDREISSLDAGLKFGSKLGSNKDMKLQKKRLNELIKIRDLYK